MAPWQGWSPAHMYFCEASVDQWIRQPVNAWSNVAVLLAGIYILRLAIADQRKNGGLFGAIVVALGLGSFFFHASETHLGEVLDLAGMYLVLAFAAKFSLQRLKKPKAIQWLMFFVVFWAQLITALVFPVYGSAIFAACLAMVVVAEVIVWRSLGTASIKIGYGNLLSALGIFSLGYVFWVLDYYDIWCDPSNHLIQGHAIWHIASGVALIFYDRFCKNCEKSL